jgi:hypothetical protein
LAILWNPASITLGNLFSTKWNISSRYRIIVSKKEGYITNIYGPSNSAKKPTFLENLGSLKEIVQNNKWIQGADFNIILSLAKKRGDIHILYNDSEGLQNLIEVLSLVDLENINGDFTWSNRH